MNGSARDLRCELMSTWDTEQIQHTSLAIGKTEAKLQSLGTSVILSMFIATIAPFLNTCN